MQADAAPLPDAFVPKDAPAPDAFVPDAFVPHDAPVDAPCTPVTTELLVNGNFDGSPTGTGWTQQPIDTSYPDIAKFQDPVSGTDYSQSHPYVAWLGGLPASGSALTDQVYQDVAVPAGTTQLVLTGYYVVGTTETSTGVVDTGSLDLVHTDGTLIENVVSATNLTNTANWTAISHTFAASVAGTTVRLRMTTTSHGDGSGQDYTNFFFDTFSLKATHCP